MTQVIANPSSEALDENQIGSDLNKRKSSQLKPKWRTSPLAFTKAARLSPEKKQEKKEDAVVASVSYL